MLKIQIELILQNEMKILLFLVMLIMDIMRINILKFVFYILIMMVLKIEMKNIFIQFGYADYPFISKFCLRFMSIFYHYERNVKKDNVFEIVGYPAYSNVEDNDIFINSHTNIFSLENYVTKGTGEFAFSSESDSEPIYIYFPEVDEIGEMKLLNGESIIAGTSKIYNSKTTSFIYYSTFDYRIVNIKFQPIRDGLYGKYCWISFEVKNCYLGLSTNKYEPNYQKCSSCANSWNYYQKGDKINDNTMNCLNIEQSEGYYKDITNIIKWNTIFIFIITWILCTIFTIFKKSLPWICCLW